MVDAHWTEPTPALLWSSIGGGPIDDRMLRWPPDVFALTDAILERSEAYRFALSPPTGSTWPPTQVPEWADTVAAAGRDWSARVEDGNGTLPELVTREWAVLREAEDEPLEHVADGQAWRVCEALLTLHAVADEACAGLGVAFTASDPRASRYRARGRELLARTGSLSRTPTNLVRVLPKVRTAPRSSSARGLARYAAVVGPGTEAHWHKVPRRRAGTDLHTQGTNFLLLPWPLRVRESDFRPVEGSVRSLTTEPYGFFEFTPSEALDLDLVDRMLVAAHDEVETVDGVVLPECAVDETELDGLEAVLGSHGVPSLVTGVRQRPEQPGELPLNAVHVAQWTGDHWLRIRQYKHHRWSLDEDQIYQYHLGGALHPHVRWWESTAVPRRSIQFVEVGVGITVTALVCEDLAQIDSVADMLRSVGPTIVVTPLLDGPQLTSRWAARYAGVLADDPGSAVLTLTSYGMAQRSRPHGREPSTVIALWKDPVRGVREIPLEPGAQGVLVTASADLTTRRSGDGRRPIDNCTEFFDVGVYQVRAAPEGSGRPMTQPEPRTAPPLEDRELTILMSWAEAVAETAATAIDRAASILDDARPGLEWRAELALVEPSPQLAQAIDSMQSLVRAATAAATEQTLSELLAAVRSQTPGEAEVDRLAHVVLRSALEQRLIRHERELRRDAPAGDITLSA